MWDAPPALAALVKRVYVSMVGSRRDHSVCAVGRSGTGKTTACQAFTHALLKLAGTTGEKMSGEYGGCADPSCPPSLQMVDPSVLFPPPVERVQAMFTVLKSFGCVNSQHSDASSRFAMVFSLDFNHAGQAAAGHLQARNTHKHVQHSRHTHRYDTHVFFLQPDDDAGQVEGLSHDSRREQLPGLLSDAGGNQHRDEVSTGSQVAGSRGVCCRTELPKGF